MASKELRREHVCSPIVNRRITSVRTRPYAGHVVISRVAPSHIVINTWPRVGACEHDICNTCYGRVRRVSWPPRPGMSATPKAEPPPRPVVHNPHTELGPITVCNSAPSGSNANAPSITPFIMPDEGTDTEVNPCGLDKEKDPPVRK